MTSPTPSEPLTGPQYNHAPPIAPALGVKLAGAAIVAIYGVQILLGSLGAHTLAASSISYLVVIAALVVVLTRTRIAAARVGWRRPPARFLIAAVLVGGSAWYLTLWVVHLVGPPGDPGKLASLVASTPLVATLVALALLPALAEELVFRGVLARSLAPRVGNAVAIVISAAVFGAYHLFPPQIVSTFVLGLVLGFLTLRSGSVVPAMIAHVLNNTIAIVLQRDEIPGAGAWVTANPAIMLASCALLLTGGLVLAAKAIP